MLNRHQERKGMSAVEHRRDIYRPGIDPTLRHNSADRPAEENLLRGLCHDATELVSRLKRSVMPSL